MMSKTVIGLLGYWATGVLRFCCVAVLPLCFIPHFAGRELEPARMTRSDGGLRSCYWIMCAFAALLTLGSCSSKRQADSGSLKLIEQVRPLLLVDADAGLESVIKQQQEVFGYLYDTVKLSVAYKNEAEMFDDFRHKKASVLIISHVLSNDEKENLKTRDTIYTQEVRVAYDAVALIANKHFDDSKLDTETLKKYFDSRNQASVSMVFEQNASVVKYVLNLLGFTNKVSSGVYAVKSTQEVIDYVKQNNNAIGFIPYNYLGDINDERVKKVFKKIKVLSLRTKSREGKEVRASANQSDIAEGIYPLMRVINVVTLYSYDNNDARLFVDFLFKEKGARIFLKAGLIPVQVPERIIDVNTEGLKRAER